MGRRGGAGGGFTLLCEVHPPTPSDSGEGRGGAIDNSTDRGPASQLSASPDVSQENHPSHKAAAEAGLACGGLGRFVDALIFTLDGGGRVWGSELG